MFDFVGRLEAHLPAIFHHLFTVNLTRWLPAKSWQSWDLAVTVYYQWRVTRKQKVMVLGKGRRRTGGTQKLARSLARSLCVTPSLSLYAPSSSTLCMTISPQGSRRRHVATGRDKRIERRCAHRRSNNPRAVFRSSSRGRPLLRMIRSFFSDVWKNKLETGLANLLVQLLFTTL